VEKPLDDHWRMRRASELMEVEGAGVPEAVIKDVGRLERLGSKLLPCLGSCSQFDRGLRPESGKGSTIRIAESIDSIGGLHLRNACGPDSALAVKLVQITGLFPDGLLHVVPGLNNIGVRELLQQDGGRRNRVPQLVASIRDVEQQQREARQALSFRKGGPQGLKAEADRAMI